MMLNSNIIHLWTVKLNQLEVANYETILSKDEQERALRFRFEQHRTYFVATRVTLRKLLGLYLAVEPRSINFDYQTLGKPFLKNEACHFNVSHSGDMALLAFAQHPIGIDLEVTGDDKLSVAERFFSPSEITYLKALPLTERTSAFYQLWTKKEAALKALGTGLSHPLNSFSIDLKASKQTMNFSDQSMTIMDVCVPSGYHAAVASFHPNPSLEYQVFAEKLTS